MKIVTWNVNGIRTFKCSIKKTLEDLDADIICVQETKVTRDLLDEKTAIVDGYNSYFSYSRGRSGYSGVATYCRDRATPVAAEEGLTGLLVKHDAAVGCYGDQTDFSSEELQLLDNEGRAVITQHKIMCSDKEETLTVINVYCPRADPEKPERKRFKLQFYRLLQVRAEALLDSGSHVIVLGDVNTSHKLIDHCDPSDSEDFAENPGRKWLNGFLRCTEEDGDETPRSHAHSGKFVDAFRRFHPTRAGAFTCWSTLTGARHTNYGTRIDYILADWKLADGQLVAADIMPEVEGSDHCPVWARLACTSLPASRPPPACTRYLPEFAGKQQKLSSFLVRVEQGCAPSERRNGLPGSQDEEERRENLNPTGDDISRCQKRSMTDLPVPKRKKPLKPQGSLLSFFKPKHADVKQSNVLSLHDDITSAGRTKDCAPASSTAREETRPAPGLSGGVASTFWKSVLRGPPAPPSCKVHQEPCVLRTVKKEGPNLGRQFFVCRRPQGHASNPEARCNFFTWVERGKPV